MPADFSLERLIAPITRDTFLQEYWEEKILLVQRGAPDYFASLLSLDDIDRVVTALSLDRSSISMVNAKEDLAADRYCYPSGMVDAAGLGQAFADGGTVILPQLHLKVPGLADLCRAMEHEFAARFQTNVYLTPPGDAQGFKPHYDNHDVFVLQIAGTKSWRIYDTPVELPTKGQPFDPSLIGQGDLSQEFDLKAGDMLYVPRGVMHDAVSGSDLSLHITLGALTKTWSDLLQEALIQLTVRERDLRRSLPVGFGRAGFDRSEARDTFRDLLQRLADQASFDDAFDIMIDDIVSSRHALVWGQLGQILQLPQMTLDTRVGTRPNLLYEWETDEEEVRLSCYGKEVVLPRHASEPAEFALTCPDFAVRDLPGDLDDDGRLVLVRRLIREGLVMFVGESPEPTA